MRGAYVLFDKFGNEVAIVPNTLVGEGHAALMDALFNRDDITNVSFEFGVFSEVPAYGTVFSAAYASEPVGNGYARDAIAASGWTITTDGEEVYATSPAVTFTAAGGDFDKTFNRFFMILLIEQPAATVTQTLASYSSALAEAVQILNGQSYVMAYRVYTR